jgi:hypothetical protein
LDILSVFRLIRKMSSALVLDVVHFKVWNVHCLLPLVDQLCIVSFDLVVRLLIHPDRRLLHHRFVRKDVGQSFLVLRHAINQLIKFTLIQRYFPGSGQSL